MNIENLTLKGARLVRGYTQRELAKVIGVHPQTISDWEKNPEKVPMSAAKIIVETLGVDYHVFFNNDSTKCR